MLLHKTCDKVTRAEILILIAELGDEFAKILYDQFVIFQQISQLFRLVIGIVGLLKSRKLDIVFQSSFGEMANHSYSLGDFVNNDIEFFVLTFVELMHFREVVTLDIPMIVSCFRIEDILVSEYFV